MGRAATDVTTRIQILTTEGTEAEEDERALVLFSALWLLSSAL
jgi:hypothetical protein